MTQVPFDFGRPDKLARSKRDLLRFLDDAVESVGLIVAAGACDARKADLSHALADREGRHVHPEWIWAIADVASYNHRLAIANALVVPIGFTPVPIKPLDDREARLRLEAALRSLGPVGEQALRDALGGRAPP